jgi:molybdopterin synthase sulfur carrier subunit
VRWKLFADLAEIAGGREHEVDVDPDPDPETETETDGTVTAGDALDALLADRPALADRVLEDGALRADVNLLVDGRDVRDGAGLETPVDRDAELALFPPVSGGTDG